MTARPQSITASTETANAFMWRRVRCSQIQKLARIRHEAGEPVDWRAFAFTATTERLWLKSGTYRSDDWRRTKSWPAANASTFLLYGRNAPFERREDVPAEIWAKVEEGVAAGLACGHESLSATAIAHRLGVTTAFRREHKLWMIGANDKTRSELQAESKALAAERQRARREAERKRQESIRRDAGARPRSDYLDAAALRREAITIAGISESTFKRRSAPERAALLQAARDARGSGPSPYYAQYIYITVDAYGLSPHELDSSAAADTPAAPPAPVPQDIVSPPAPASSGTVAISARGRRMKPQPNRPPYPFPPCRPVLIAGLPVQTFLLTEQAAECAASAYWRQWKTGARVIGILDEHERWLARMMTMHKATPDEISEARIVMNRRFTEIVGADRDSDLPALESDNGRPRLIVTSSKIQSFNNMRQLAI